MEAKLELIAPDKDLFDLPDEIKKAFNMISIKIEQDLVNAIDNNTIVHSLSINLNDDVDNCINYKLTLNELEMFAAQLNQMIKSFRADYSDFIKERSKKLRLI